MWLVAIQLNGKCNAVDSLVSLAFVDSDARLLELIRCSLVSLSSSAQMLVSGSYAVAWSLTPLMTQQLVGLWLLV